MLSSTQPAMQPVFQPVIQPFIQSAYADKSFTFNDNQNNDCEQFGIGVNSPNCSNTITEYAGIDLWLARSTNGCIEPV